jgi:hypothetical protein
MPIRNVTKKRTGKANKRNKAYVSKTFAIRTMRAAFFLLIGLFIVYLYFLYENGSLVDNLQRINLSGLFLSGFEAIKANPILIVLLLIYGAILLWIGYYFGKRQS